MAGTAKKPAAGRRRVQSPRTQPPGPRALTQMERIQFEGLFRYQRDLQEQMQKFQGDLDLVAAALVQRLGLGPDARIGVGQPVPGVTHVVTPDWHLVEVQDTVADATVEVETAE